jgi:hypothetical protein
MKSCSTALACLALLVAGGTGCEKSATYSYFNVHVTLDRTSIDDELLDLIDACAAFADTPLREDTSRLPCVRHRVPNDLGVFQYTTSLIKGEIKFRVIMNGYWGPTLAQGELEPLGIAPGTTTERTLVVNAIPGVPRVPAGTITPVGDGAPDSATTGNDARAIDVGTDTAAGGADAGADAAPDAGSGGSDASSG